MRRDPENRALWQAVTVLGQAYPSLLIRPDGKKASVRRMMQQLGDLFKTDAELDAALTVIGDSESRERVRQAIALYRVVI